MEHKTHDQGNGTTHYWSGGTGDRCIFFAHGATMDHGLFQHQVDHFAERFRVIAWDAPAHGLSRPYQEFSLDQSAKEIAAILDQEGVEEAHLVGQSMGGYMVQLAAKAFPARVKSLAVVGASPVQRSYYSRLDLWLLSVTPAILRWCPYQWLTNAIATQVAIEESSRQYAIETLRTYAKAEIANIMQAVGDGVHEFEESRPLQLPQLVVFGANERTGKVRGYCERWASNEGLPIRVIANAAHNCNMDNPAEFNAVLGEFLDSVDKPAG